MNYKNVAVALIFIPALSFATLKNVEIVKGFQTKIGSDFFDYNYPSVLAKAGQAPLLTATNTSPYDTHMRSNANMIPLSIPFSVLTNSDVVKTIGFAPTGTWINKGWTGIVQFFKYKDIGICEYSKNRLYHMQIHESVMKYDVNQKLTTTNIQGKPGKGYLYVVEWYEEDKNDQLYENTVECENDKNDPIILNKLTALACKIDSGN